MRTYAQKPKASQQTASAKSTLPGRTHFGQSREVNSFLHLQRTIGNQTVQRLLQTSAGEPGEASSSLTSPRFGHDFSRIPVNDSQARARTSSEESASPRSFDMEGTEGAEEVGEMDQDAPEFRHGPSHAAQAPTHALGGTLTYREATELLDCVRIMGEANAAYCRQVVLGEAPPPQLSVTVPHHVRSASTPRGMPDRIPPRVNTPAVVALTGWRATMPPVTLSVRGAGGANGSVTINGVNSVDLTDSGTVQLRGVDQTTPGSGGGLHLVARQGPRVLASSSGFSVSSIPRNFSVTFNSQISTPTMRGLRVNNHWESDSGNVADLDEAERSEQVQYGAATGIWAGVVGGNNSGYLPANSPPLVDSHGTPLARFTGPGSRIAEQTFTFNDRRTGAADIPATNSGFRLTRTAVTNAAGSIEFTVDKRGAATSANGFASAAGSGSVTRTQVI